MTLPVLAPRGFHARDARAVTSGRLEVDMELPPPPSRELESTPATLTLAFCCGEEVQHNEKLQITFCGKCGYRGTFRVVTLHPHQAKLGV